MVLDTLRRLTAGPKPVVLMFILLLASFYLISGAVQNSATFGRLYSLLLAINLFTLLLLLALIGRNLIRLVQQYRHNDPGSRLTVRMVVMFLILAVTPVSVVYYFSLQFLNRGIDSWFDVRVEQALEDALELGRSALDVRLREHLRQTRNLALELRDVPEATAILVLNDLRQRSEAAEMTLLTQQGKVIASSSADPANIIPDIPPDTVLRQLRQGLDYARLDPQGRMGLNIRIALTLPNPNPMSETRIVHALYPMEERQNTLADSVQSAFAQYKELAFLREPLKYSFTLTLSLILLLSLLTAVWAAFFSARRLVAPIRDLAEGTRAVASGDYNKRLPLPGRDELGFLVRSFNEMTHKLAQSHAEAHRSQQEVEAQRAYLATVLARLSSGVLTFDEAGCLRTVNTAASEILGARLEQTIGSHLDQLRGDHPTLDQFVEAITPHLHTPQPDWHAEVVLFAQQGRQVLMCHGVSLSGIDTGTSGHLIVFDDITALVKAQRDAAWGEVARRLAHEIKNPLTPIQLSAERLRHKYLATMEPGDADILDRSTHTIVQQVEGMKEMVKAFTDYARPPAMQPQPLDLNRLINEVLDLYRANPQEAVIETQLDPAMPSLEADANQLRQVLHNLLKNALEAEAGGQLRIRITTRCASEAECRFVELSVEDNGPGIPEAIHSQLFEPYVSNKPRGTGLGLAIVKKIIEEHGGMIWAENGQAQGARFIIRLPVHPKAMEKTETVGSASTKLG